ncbi:cadherin-related family member 5-like isoform X1 [Poeciliopsis prolifica]|uniref:cadherin-related family member 5-like isoform X1 n=1 Tax=Poeciliopsis prolifica TaxID=188132 RepID=UPI002413AC66|nr:cadherin-related family member 5-like isoform X1 [Poeciliopsis prolifica]
MDSIDPYLSVGKLFICLLLVLLQASNAASQSCSFNSPVQLQENNNVGDVVTTISITPGETIIITNTEMPFDIINGNQLIATKVLDYEETQNYAVGIRCTLGSGSISKTIVVIVQNVNDNAPVFGKDLYQQDVKELSDINSVVGQFSATDLDGTVLYYTLTSESEPDAFKLTSQSNPEILVNRPLDYDEVKEVRLILEAQDTPLASPPEAPSFTATTTIMISIIDIDNRPPWFEPCSRQTINEAVICQNTGYTGNINLNEQETGVLPLNPGPVYAIDGDVGINEAITYSIISGNEDELFQMNANTGNITMKKPTDVVGEIVLTVLAAQSKNTHQFATTTVTIRVLVKSLHAPEFQKPQYEGLITSVGSMALDLTNKDQPLHIIATDEDYIGAGGINPNITYSVKGSSDFVIIGGYLFLTKDLPESSVSLQVVATDTSNDETATAALRVELTSSLSTTTLPQSTTGSMTTTAIEKSTSDSVTTKETMTTSNSTLSTGTIFTTRPTDGVSTASTARPVGPAGGFGIVDMAALGATLGVLLFLCVLVIGLLVYRIRRGNTAWKKIQEASMFRSSLGQANQKEGIQYTNEAFQNNDDDRSSTGSGGPQGRSVSTSWHPPKPVENSHSEEMSQSSSAQPRTRFSDNASDSGSDRADNEKEVKPILTKERRVEEGYKSVWFKEDIDPNAKEEVVIIPENRNEHSDDEDEGPSSDSREDEDNHLQRKSPKVLFAETDLDSGLGVKFDDPADDSEDDDDKLDFHL